MNTDLIIRIAAIVIVFSGAAISVYYRRKADQNAAEKVTLTQEGLPMLLALRLTGLAGWGTAFAWMINPDWVRWSFIDLPDWMRWTGLAIGVLCVGLIYWIFSNLGNNVTPTVITREKAQLVTSGPYRYVRHPLYSMGLINFIGFGMLAENWFIPLCMVIGFILLAIRADKEEEQLIEKFGDAYREYMKTTGRFFPKFN